jgi:hypothetical protein
LRVTFTRGTVPRAVFGAPTGDADDAIVNASDQIERAERLARVLGRLDECSVDVLSLLDALSISALRLDDDHDGAARAAYEREVERMRAGDLE